MSFLATSRRITAAPTEKDVIRFMDQACFGVRLSEVATVQAQGRKGLAAWIEDQFTKPTYNLMDYETAKRATGGSSSINEPMYNQVLAGVDPLRWRCFTALQNFFVINIANVAGYDGDNYGAALLPHTFGNWRTLIEVVSKQPAMAKWLTYFNNAKEANGVQPDENYAREIMQLFSIGLWELNMDGTRKTKGSLPVNDPRYVASSIDHVPTYTLADVRGMARVFTGWCGGSSQQFGMQHAADMRVPMYNDPTKHELGTKEFLGVTIPANTNAEASLAIALDTLFNHPCTAPFFCKNMIQRFVTANPSPDYVARVASVFVKDPLTGVRGDLKAVWRAILLDAEARSIWESRKPTYGKVREPYVSGVGLVRTWKGAVDPTKLYAYGDSEMRNWQAMMQRPFEAPSVFNYFLPYYTPGGNIPDGMFSPELQVYGESEAIQGIRAQFTQWYNAFVQSSGSEILQLDISEETALAATPDMMFDLIAKKMNVEMSATRRQQIIDWVTASANATSVNFYSKNNRACLMLGFIGGATERQVQK